jgi:phosphoglycerol geranylgeranyltransferase
MISDNYLLDTFATLKKHQKKALAVLIDPDQGAEAVLNTAQLCQLHAVDLVFVGGSLITNGVLKDTLKIIKQNYFGLVYIFPGNELMIDEQADGILLLSLLSGRNPEFLIGKHVVAAPNLIKSKLDIVPTAYLLIDGGKETSVSYISNTKPIPADKPDIALATALAGQLLGLRCLYMDAGSGAHQPISTQMIKKIKHQIQIPMIIGGGIKTAEKALDIYKAGADVIVIGNGVEDNQSLIETISQVKNKISEVVSI